MPEKLNSAFVDTLCAHIPKPENPVSVLTDALRLGREAAYRRLRGEVQFTFGEAAVLSDRLRFSLDKINRTNPRKDVLCRLKVIDFSSPLKAYYDYLKRDVRFLTEMAADPLTEFSSACNSIPPEFYFKYDHLADFMLFKWLYQHGLASDSVRSFEQMHTSSAMRNVYAEYVEGIQSIPRNSYVFDDCGFRHWFNAVRAFRAMHLLSEQSVQQIRDELLLLLDELETFATVGRYPNGSEVEFYLSEVSMESSYSYVSSSKYHAVAIGIFSLNALRTTDASLFEFVKHWIQTQKRFSSQISCSGERARMRYFIRQRELLDKLDGRDLTDY